MDQGLTGLYECIGLIPVYMAKIITGTLNKMLDSFRNHGIDYSLLGFITIKTQGSTHEENYVCGSLVYKGYGGFVDVLDLSGLMLDILSPSSPRELFISPVNRVKKRLDKILKIYSLRGYKPSQLLREGVRCYRNGRCIISNYGRLSKSITYLTLSVKCMGKTLYVKTMELADEIVDEIYTYTRDLVLTLFMENNIRIERRDLEKYIAKQILDEIKWYTRKYYIDIPESIEKLELYTFIEE